jgi:hypothetical protein
MTEESPSSSRGTHELLDVLYKRTIRKGIYMDRIAGRGADSCDTRLLSCLAVGSTVRREVEL